MVMPQARRGIHCLGAHLPVMPQQPVRRCCFASSAVAASLQLPSSPIVAPFAPTYSSFSHVSFSPPMFSVAPVSHRCRLEGQKGRPCSRCCGGILSHRCGDWKNGGIRRREGRLRCPPLLRSVV